MNVFHVCENKGSGAHARSGVDDGGGLVELAFHAERAFFDAGRFDVDLKCAQKDKVISVASTPKCVHGTVRHR